MVQSKAEDVLVERTPFELAAQGEIFPDMKVQLDVDLRDEATGMSLLHVAASHGQMGAVRVLLSRGADINSQDDEGKTALHLCSFLGHIHVMRELLMSPLIDVDICDDYGATPLMYAVYNNQVKGVQELIKSDSDISIQNSDGETAYSICHKKDLSDIRLILDKYILDLIQINL